MEIWMNVSVNDGVHVLVILLAPGLQLELLILRVKPGGGGGLGR